MASRTFYLDTTVASGSAHLTLADSDPGTATTGTGWTVGTDDLRAYAKVLEAAARLAEARYPSTRVAPVPLETASQASSPHGPYRAADSQPALDQRCWNPGRTAHE